MTSTNIQDLHQAASGRFYLYDRKTFLKLKQLHRRFCSAQHKASRWHRWARKAPRNRVTRRIFRNSKNQKIGFEIVGPAPEPQICSVFSRKADYKANDRYWSGMAGVRTHKTYWMEDNRKQRINGPNWQPLNADIYRYIPTENGGCVDVDSFGIDRAYRQAKHPVRKDHQETPELTKQRIEELFKQL